MAARLLFVLWAVLGLSSPAAVMAAGLIQPRIFNGIVTFEYPFVGLLLERNGTSDAWRSHCSLSLIGPRVALTAAHCLCDAHGSLCQPEKRYAPQLDRFRVLLQNAGMLEIESVGIPGAFDFPDRDFAVLVLREPVSGIAPAVLADGLPEPGTDAQIIGFGSTSAYRINTGVKRVGAVEISACGNGLDDSAFVCWTADGGRSGANTCPGDSGAPLLVPDGQGQPVLAGVASGGYGACDGEDLAFDTAVAPHQTVIGTMAGGTGATAAGSEAIARARVLEGGLSTAAPELVLTITVPAGATRLVAVGNGEDSDGNDYVLRVAQGVQTDTEPSACTSDLPGVFEACIIEDPAPGTWTVRYAYGVGLGGEAQLSATAFEPTCGLDVDADGRFDALTDGLLVWRHLAGIGGADLTASAIGTDAARTEPLAIAGFLDREACVDALDVDRDGARLARTDGILVLRHLFGFSGAALVEGALGPSATRTAPDRIRTALEALRR